MTRSLVSIMGSSLFEDLKEIFTCWNSKKIDTHLNDKVVGIKERDIVFIKMGKNIGYEQDGKGDEFLRPVVIYKKFNKNMFLGIPLTTKQKNMRYYFEFEYQTKRKKSVVNSAILSQLRVFDTKRVKYKSGVISKEMFSELHKVLQEIISPADSNFPSCEEKSPEGIQ